MKGTVKDYTTAIKWMLDIEGIEATNAANHRMLEEGKITQAAFLAAAGIIANKSIGKKPVSESWEKEKARKAKFAQKLRDEMDAAIEDNDPARFHAAYTKSMNYMRKRERGTYYRRFLEMRRAINPARAY
jgi:hypothetical protein